MAYATLQDAYDLYGNTYIDLACTRDGVTDTDAFTRHLEVASQEMDAYLLGRYPLPHPAPPAIFVKRCVDIAVYNSTPNADTRTTEMRARYDDCLAYLDKIRLNQLKLQYATADETTPNQSQLAETTPGRSITVTAPARIFTSDNTRRIL
jgi:phage gp36-like protein